MRGSYIDIHDNENVYLSVDKAQVNMGDKPSASGRKNGAKGGTKAGGKPRERQTMTFGVKSGVTEAHLVLLYMKLTSEEGWIEGNEADFKALFSGQRDADCWLTWTSKYGKSTLVGLFERLRREQVVIVPDGFSLSGLLEGHFKNASGQTLTGLDKGDKPANQALPVIEECAKLMTASATVLKNGTDADSDDFPSSYDPFDHQDLRLRNKHGRY